MNRLVKTVLLAGAAWGPSVEEQWGVPARQVDFYDVKMDVEALFGARGSRLRFAAAAHPALHPGRSARVELDGRQVGWIGELHPRWAQQADLAHAPVVFELDVQALSEGELLQVRELSRQPVVVRDLALWVDAPVTVQSMLDTVAATAAMRLLLEPNPACTGSGSLSTPIARSGSTPRAAHMMRAACVTSSGLRTPGSRSSPAPGSRRRTWTWWWRATEKTTSPAS